MKINKTAIVTTTINLPTFLKAYFENFKNYGISPEEVKFIIVGDKKSPPESKKFAEKFTDFPVEFWDIPSQEDWIKKNYPDKVGKANFIMPLNSIRRRNFGYLRALELEADAIITIDDDNYAGDEDWLNGHLDAFKKPATLVSSRNKFVNYCQMLNINRQPIYSRGFPVSKMFLDTFTTGGIDSRKVVLNAGLWTKKPDVSSYDNIIHPDLESSGFKENYLHRYALAPHQYMSVSTQNTAFLKELVPASYVLLMETKIYDNKMDRFDDIWSGFFALKLINQMKDSATFGSPLAIHDRNVHDYVADLKSELVGIEVNNYFFNLISNMNLQSTNYKDGYIELADKLTEHLPFTDSKIIEYFQKLNKAMHIWIELVEEWL